MSDNDESFAGGSDSDQIGDFSNSATGGCRHIRLQTLNSSTIFYSASTPKLSSPSRCGFIVTSSTAGGGGLTPTSGA